MTRIGLGPDGSSSLLEPFSCERFVAMPTERRRLTVSEVENLIVHDDVLIRDIACEYLTGGACATENAWQRLLDAEEETRPNMFGLPRCLRDVPLPPHAVAPLLEAANSCRKVDFWGFERALVQAPLQGFEGCDHLIAKLPGGGIQLNRCLGIRRELLQLSGDELWQSLVEFSEDCLDAGKHWNEVDWFVVDAHIQRLVELSSPDEYTIRRLIRRCVPGDHDGEWIDAFAIRLAGKMRMQSAVPDLLDVLSCDELDAEHSEACTALTRIGTSCLPEIKRRWSEFPQAFAAEVLGNIKHPEALDTAIQCLQGEADKEAATWLGFAILQQFDSAGIEPVADLIERGHFEPACTELREDILPILEILDMDHPSADRWRLEVVQERLEWQREIEDSLGSNGPPFIASQIVNETPKVGRNDPCPCGSGKKYKKCCLKNAVVS